MTLLLPSCLSHEPNWGFSSRGEEGFYQQEVSHGTTEGLEATGKPAMLRVPHGSSVGCQGLAAPHSPAAFQSHAEPLLTVHLNPWIHLLLLYTSRRVACSPKHLHWPEISSALGCSFSSVTVCVYDKHLSQAQTYLCRLTAAPAQRL